MTRAETRFRLLTKRTSPFKSAGASVQSTTGRRAVHISLQGLYCSCKPVFCNHVMLTGYPFHSLVSPSLLLPCVTVCHHVSNAVYNDGIWGRRDTAPPDLNLGTRQKCGRHTPTTSPVGEEPLIPTGWDPELVRLF
jgi:hypothetical protein